MAHNIDLTLNKPAIAFVGKVPWHGLGQQLTPGQSIDTWRIEAGLNYDVLESPVMFSTGLDGKYPMIDVMPSRKVLYRNEVNAPLAVVGKDSKVVQPSEVLDFFAKLADIGGFDLEVAGALSGGTRIWGLAKISDGAPIIGHDQVKPYLLLATSYDGTMSTIAKLVAIRVVCNNTLQVSLGEAERIGAVSSVVKVPHNLEFKPDEVRMQLGIVADAFERWTVQTRLLAETPLPEAAADEFINNLLASIHPNKEPHEIKALAAYDRLTGLYQGQGLIGSDLDGGFTKWRMLNCVSQMTDWERGGDKTRLNSAWFGSGNNIKNKAYSLLSA